MWNILQEAQLGYQGWRFASCRRWEQAPVRMQRSSLLARSNVGFPMAEKGEGLELGEPRATTYPVVCTEPEPSSHICWPETIEGPLGVVTRSA